MSARLRRPPLLGVDGCLGIPIVGKESQKDPLLQMKLEALPPKSLDGDKLRRHKTHLGKQTPNKAVNFSMNNEGEKKREKYLTAKYGAHQMALIRKRLKVEMWMFDQLQEILEVETEASNDINIDLDEVLDIDDEGQRKSFICDILEASTSSQEVINKFAEELLERAKTL